MSRTQTLFEMPANTLASAGTMNAACMLSLWRRAVNKGRGSRRRAVSPAESVRDQQASPV